MPRIDRSWRFINPDFDIAGSAGGLQLSTHGGIEMAEDGSSVRQAILLLISTLPGERIMRPDYGCNLHWLVFSPNDDTTAGLALHYVRSALERWEPRIEIVSLDASRDLVRPELLIIHLGYRVRASRISEQLEFSMNLMGEEA